MAAITIAAFKALNLGYLTGADLLQFAPYQILASQYDIDNASIQQGCNFAYSELISNLRTRYDVPTELAKTGSARSSFCVKLTAILAVKYILSNVQNISATLQQTIQDNKWDLINIRNGQLNVDLNTADSTVASVAELIPSSFQTLG